MSKLIDVKSILQQAAQNRALIGLEDVFQYEDRSGNVVFNCTLCDVKLLLSELIRHVTGDTHRTFYLKNHNLEMYKEIYQQSRTETHYGKLLEMTINKIMQKMGGFHKYSNIEMVQRTHSNHMDINEQRPKSCMRKDAFGNDIPTIGALQAPKVQVSVVSDEQLGLMKRTQSRRKDFDSQSIEVSIHILVQHSEINEDFASKMTHGELRQLYAVALEKRALEKRIARLNRSAKIEGFNSHEEREELGNSYNVISRDYSAILSDVHRRLNKEVKSKRMVTIATTTEKEESVDGNPPAARKTCSNQQQQLDYEKLAVKLPDNMPDNILQHVSDWESEQKHLRYKEKEYHHHQYKYADDDDVDDTYEHHDDVTQPLHHQQPPPHLSVIATTEDEVDWKYNGDDSYMQQKQQQIRKDELLPIRTSSPIPRYENKGGGGDGYDAPKTSHPQYTTKCDGGVLDYESNQYWQDDDIPPQNNDDQQYNEEYCCQHDCNYPHDGAREQQSSYHTYEVADDSGKLKEYDYYGARHQQPTTSSYNYNDGDVTLPTATSSTRHQQRDDDVFVSTTTRTSTTTVMAAHHLKESLQLLKRKITMEGKGRPLTVTNFHHKDGGDGGGYRSDDGYEYNGERYNVNDEVDGAGVKPIFSCRINDDYDENFNPRPPFTYGKAQLLATRKRKLDERGDHVYKEEQQSPKRRVVMVPRSKQPLLSITPKHHPIPPKKKVLLPTPPPEYPPSYKTPTRFPPRRLKSLVPPSRPPILGNMSGGGSFLRPKPPPPPRVLGVRPSMRRPIMMMNPRFHHQQHQRVKSPLLNRPPPPQRRPAAAAVSMRRSLMTMKVRPFRPTTGYPSSSFSRAPMQRFPPPPLSARAGW